MVDLHTHSSESDGTDSPAALIRIAKRSRLKAIALTDHDTIAGLKEAGREAAKFGITFIPGIEIEIDFADGEFHLLGLGLKKISRLNSWLRELRKIRNERNQALLKKMQAAGIKVTLRDLKAIAGGSIIAKPHFARLLVNKGFCKSTDEAFRDWLRRGKPFYIRKNSPTFAEAVRHIHEAEGKAVVAHPNSLGLAWEDLTAFLLKLKRGGLDGVEVYHPKAPRELSTRLAEFTAAEGFLVSGGSDFHGKLIPKRRLGHTGPKKPIPDRIASPFYDF